MFPADAFIIRPATEADAAALTGRVLIGELEGKPAAALSLKTGVAIADPFQRTDALRAYLRMRASAVEAVDREPSLRERMLDALRHPAPVRSTA